MQNMITFTLKSFLENSLDINDSELWVNAGNVERNMGIRNHHS